MRQGRPAVAVVTANFAPEQTSTGQTVTEFAGYLADHDVDVRVATAMPYYPEWQIRPGYRGRLWMRERLDGMAVYRSWHLVRPDPSTAVRILHEATLSLFALPNILRVLVRADVAYVASPALSYAFTGIALARLLGKRTVLGVKDVQPDAAIDLGMMRNPMMIAVSRWLARRIYDWADEIHTLGEGMRRRIEAAGTDPRKIRIVVDTIDPEELAPVPPEENEFRRCFVPDGTFAVLHSGNMGRKQDLDLLLRTADLLRHDPRFHFYVFGDGAEKGRFLSGLAELGLRNVTHQPLQDRVMLRHMLSGADAVLVSQLPEVVDIVFPSKLVTALAAGAMVVVAAAADSEAALAVRSQEAGVTVPAGDERALAAMLQSLAAGEVDIPSFRARARACAVERFGRDAVYGPEVERLKFAFPRNRGVPPRDRPGYSSLSDP